MTYAVPEPFVNIVKYQISIVVSGRVLDLATGV